MDISKVWEDFVALEPTLMYACGFMNAPEPVGSLAWEYCYRERFSPEELEIFTTHLVHTPALFRICELVLKRGDWTVDFLVSCMWHTEAREIVWPVLKKVPRDEYNYDRFVSEIGLRFSPVLDDYLLGEVKAKVLVQLLTPTHLAVKNADVLLQRLLQLDIYEDHMIRLMTFGSIGHQKIAAQWLYDNNPERDVHGSDKWIRYFIRIGTLVPELAPKI